MRAGRRKIQLPYVNKFKSLWEYRKHFVSGRIDFSSYLGPKCPICGKEHCYRQITSYRRYAIELFPDFVKQRIPVARFVCRKRHLTFSLLPVQLIPYHQYAVRAILGALVLGLGCWEAGQRGFGWSAEELHPDSLVTPYLVACWFELLLRGLRRGHAILSRCYNLSAIGTSQHKGLPWGELKGYLEALGWQPEIRWGPWLGELLARYSHSTGQFLFGSPSQQRG